MRIQMILSAISFLSLKSHSPARLYINPSATLWTQNYRDSLATKPQPYQSILNPLRSIHYFFFFRRASSNFVKKFISVAKRANKSGEVRTKGIYTIPIRIGIHNIQTSFNYHTRHSLDVRHKASR